jgi:3-oxoacyl-[acyl-carrier-protein] synthase-3
MVDTNDEWIKSRTGIDERRILKGEGLASSDMGKEAVNELLKKRGIQPEEIDCIICATVTPDMFFPATSNIVGDKCGLKNAFGFDVSAACSGFLYALTLGTTMVESGRYQKVIVLGVDKMSSIVDYTDRTTCVIFGDGAGAAVLSREEDLTKGILSTHLHSEGQHAEELVVKAPGMGGRWVTDILKDNDPNDESYFPYMNGQFVFKNAVVRFSEVINEGLQANNLQVSDIDMLIPHQANLRISQFIQKKFGLTDSQVFNNIQKYGNTTAASIPIALTEAWEQGKIKSGEVVVLAAFGSGFTWGSVIVKW